MYLSRIEGPPPNIPLTGVLGWKKTLFKKLHNARVSVAQLDRAHAS